MRDGRRDTRTQTRKLSLKRRRQTSLPLQPVIHNLEYRGPDVGSWHRSQITPLGETYAVAGPDRDLVIRELSRLQKSVGQQRRRHLAILGGSASLVIIGVTVWLIVESVYALTATSQQDNLQRWIFALVEIILWAISLVCTAIVLFFFRTRKPTTASRIIQPLAVAVCALQVILAIIDFALIGAWQDQVRNQCESWRVDIVWVDRGTCPGAGTSLTGFLIAAGIRLLAILIVSALWLSLIRLFVKSLEHQYDHREVDLYLLQSTEVQQILDRHSAEIIQVKPAHVLHSVTVDDRSQLPPAPERRKLLHRSQSHDSIDRPAEDAPRSGGWFWSAAAWLFGVGDTQPPDKRPRDSNDTEKALPKAPDRASSPLSAPPTVSQNFRSTPSPTRFHQNRGDPRDLQAEGADDANDSPTPNSSSYAKLFGFGRNTPSDAHESRPSTPTGPRGSTEWQDTVHPLPRDSLDTAVKKPLLSPYETQEDYSERLRTHSSSSYASYPTTEYESQVSGSSPSDEEQVDERGEPTPFRDRQMIYVQMGDGRLVHRLSTIGERTTVAGDRSTIMGSDSGAGSLRSTTPSEFFDAPLPGALPPSRGPP